MQIESNGSIMRLEDMPLDIGYASEKVTLTDKEGNTHILGGQNGKTQLIITLPFIDDAIRDELSMIAKDLPLGGEYEMTAALVVADEKHDDPEVEKFDFYIDSEGELGDFYGVRLVGVPFSGELTKSLIVISKDGAIFYDEFTKDLQDDFNTETLLRKISAAQTCYTGKGCH